MQPYRRKVAACPIHVACLALLACGGSDGSSPSTQPTTQSPSAPQVTSISPSTLNWDGPDTVLTIDGANFSATTTATWKGSSRPTSILNGGRLTVALRLSDLAKLDTGIVVVSTLGASSASDAVRVPIVYPRPVLTSINPMTVEIGDDLATMKLTGSGFRDFAVVNIREDATGQRANIGVLPTSHTNLVATFYGSTFGDRTGQFGVTVSNTTPGGGVSDTIKVQVINAAPIVTGVFPSSIPRGVDTTIFVSGSRFVRTTTAIVNGQPHAGGMSLVSGSRFTLLVPIKAAEIVSPGTLNIAAITPAPGGGTSAAVIVTIK